MTTCLHALRLWGSKNFALPASKENSRKPFEAGSDSAQKTSLFLEAPVGVARLEISLMTRSFKTDFFRLVKCSEDEYLERVFWKCLYRHALPFALPLFRLKASIFREDFDLLRDLAAATSMKEVIGELNRFYGRNVRDDSIARKLFLI